MTCHSLETNWILWFGFVGLSQNDRVDRGVHKDEQVVDVRYQASIDALRNCGLLNFFKSSSMRG